MEEIISHMKVVVCKYVLFKETSNNKNNNYNKNNLTSN